MAKTCKHCKAGNKPKQTSSGKWEHWLVKSIFPARITVTDCKAPPEAQQAA